MPDVQQRINWVLDNSGFIIGYYPQGTSGVIALFNPSVVIAPTVLQYNTGAQLLRQIRANTATLSNLVNATGDGYSDQTGINEASSLNWMYDSRRLFEPTRSGAASVGSNNTTSLSGWTTVNTGTGAVTVVADANNPVTPGANVFDLNTGATIGSQAAAQINLGSTPTAMFSLAFNTNLYAADNTANDALILQLANTAGYVLECQLLPGSFSIFLSGSYRQIWTSGGGNYYTEWWVNCVQNQNSNYTITLLAGTQIVGTLTGNLPGGGTNGLFNITQNSGTTANRHSRLSNVYVGLTQNADPLTLISNPIAAYYPPQACRLLTLYEDDAVALVPNTNFSASVSNNGGTTWEPVTLSNLGVFGPGYVDSSKNVFLLGATHQFLNPTTGSSIAYKFNGGTQWYGIAGTYMEWL